MISESQLKQLPDSEIDCLRCDTRMKDAGLISMAEGKSLASVGTGGHGTSISIHFEARICPGCGKTEFFF